MGLAPVSGFALSNDSANMGEFISIFTDSMTCRSVVRSGVTSSATVAKTWVFDWSMAMSPMPGIPEMVVVLCWTMR